MTSFFLSKASGRRAGEVMKLRVESCTGLESKYGFLELLDPLAGFLVDTKFLRIKVIVTCQ